MIPQQVTAQTKYVIQFLIREGKILPEIREHIRMIVNGCIAGALEVEQNGVKTRMPIPQFFKQLEQWERDLNCYASMEYRKEKGQ